MRKYKNVSESTWLRFPDGQEVGPGQEFRRDYNAEQLFHHKVAGITEELPEDEPTPAPMAEEASAPKRSRRLLAAATEEGGDA